MDADEVLGHEFSLTDRESAHAAVLKLLLADRDARAAVSGARDVKVALRNAYFTETADALHATGSPIFDLGQRDAADGEALTEAARAAGAFFSQRSRAMLVLVELHTFRPWPWGYPLNAQLRESALSEIAGFLTGLRTEDPTAIATELKASRRALRRKQVRWGRVATVGVIGLGLGAATMGLAAPLIGASIGAAAGLSGAAATSAGLATLGGGAVAASGFGVAGGTAVVAGVGALAGAGVAAGGARAVPWIGAGEVALGALRAEVITRLVVLGEEHDEEKAKRVVQALQARLDTVSAGITALGQRIRELSDANDALAGENAALAAENEALRQHLEDERRRAKTAEATLQVAIERIPTNGTLSIEGR